MNYEESLGYLLSFADFERTGRFQERPDVAPVIALLRRLGDPHLGRVTVHVAGTKGKGSVSAMIESLLRAAGLRTGLFTSPHLHDYTERIRIDGAPIAQGEFVALVEQLRPAVEAEQAVLSGRNFVTFDLFTAMAFLAFQQAKVDAQVIEVGLGGRLDSTNVFPAKDVAVITPLSFEHTAILGNTIKQIAREKAAVITPDCVAVMAPQTSGEAEAVIADFAARAGATLVEVEREYSWSVLEHGHRGQIIRIDGRRGAVEARLPLLGAFQAENAATAIAAVHSLEPRIESLGHVLDGEALRRGLEAVSWPGRLELLYERPLVLADGAHNAESARRLREALADHFGTMDVTFIIGSGADKDIAGLARELAPMAGRVIATKAKHPRAMDVRQICEAFARHGVPSEDVDSIVTAIDTAMAATAPGGLICLAGSLFVAAEAREYFHKQTIEPVGGVHGG